ncbi:MAG: AAA family ATPase [Planctomycetes bacterium]|nr:AAA family ATPase [Planctomycetota bacterium]
MNVHDGVFARLRAPFLLVTGGKGGVGKTTIAVNLALELARAGEKPLLVDLDLGLANVDVLMGLATPRTLEDALAGACDFADCVVAAPRGLYVLPASSGVADLAVLDDERRGRLTAGLAELSERFDCVIGDSAAGIGADVLAFAAQADCVLVVTTPDPAALTDAYGMIKALDELARKRGGDVPTPELLVNLCDGVDQAQFVGRKLRAVCERFLSRSPRLAGWLPRSRAVRESVSTQQPFVLGSRAPLENHCLRALAEHVQRLLPTADARLASLKG